VVGIAGSDEKCRWAEELGCDLCLNYKSPSFKQDLINATKDYVDVYFGKKSTRGVSPYYIHYAENLQTLLEVRF
jgi:NADPH-dependent curcumin reductase CurA